MSNDNASRQPRETRFGSMLQEILTRKGLSQNKAGDVLKCSGPFVNQIIRGRRCVPLKMIEAWCECLKLEDDQRRVLTLYAFLSQLPKEGEELVIQHLEGGGREAPPIHPLPDRAADEENKRLRSEVVMLRKQVQAIKHILSREVPHGE